MSQAEKVVVDSSASVTRVRARKSSELFFVVFRKVLLQKLNQGAPRVEKTDEEHGRERLLYPIVNVSLTVFYPILNLSLNL